MGKISVLILLLIIFSCSKKEIKKPTNFIEKDRMINLIFDMKVAEKAKNIPNKDKKKNLNYMSFIFEKYNIDSIQFKESSDYYTDNIGQYQDIYEKVQLRLKDSIEKYKKRKKEKDSLTQLKKGPILKFEGKKVKNKLSKKEKSSSLLKKKVQNKNYK